MFPIRNSIFGINFNVDITCRLFERILMRKLVRNKLYFLMFLNPFWAWDSFIKNIFGIGKNFTLIRYFKNGLFY